MNTKLFSLVGFMLLLSIPKIECSASTSLKSSSEWGEEPSYLKGEDQQQRMSPADFKNRMQSLRAAIFGVELEQPVTQKNNSPEKVIDIISSPVQSKKEATETREDENLEQDVANNRLPPAPPAYEDTELHKLIKKGDFQKCKGLLIPSLLDVPGKDKKTLLHLAVEFGAEDLCRELIKQGAKIKLKDSDDNSPLQIACLKNREVIGLMLLKVGARDTSYNKNGLTALHIAAFNNSEKLCLLLIHEQADLTMGTLKEGNTPLHIAAGQGCKKTASLFIELGAKLAIKNDEGKTPLDLALESNELEIALLVAKNKKSLVLERAICLNDSASVEKLIAGSLSEQELLYSHGLNALHLASALPRDTEELLGGLSGKAGKKVVRADLCGEEQKSQKAIIASLMKLNILDVNKADDFGRTPFHLACEWGREGALESLQTLSTQGIHKCMMQTTKNNHTPLTLAVAYNYSSLVKKILDKLIEGNHLGLVARLYPHLMEIAIDYSSLEVAHMLVEYKNRYCDDYPYNGYFLLHRACARGSLPLCKLLINESRNLDEPSFNANYAEAATNPWTLSLGDDELTPLAYAAQAGHLEVVTFLVKKGAAISTKTKAGRSPLLLACKNNHSDVAIFLIKQGAVVDEQCIELGNVELCKKIIAELQEWYDAIPKDEPSPLEETRSPCSLLTRQDARGKTILHREAEKNNPEKCAFLLDSFAQLDILDKNGRTPLHLASMIGPDHDKFRYDKPCRTIQTLVEHPKFTKEILDKKDNDKKSALDYLREGGKYSQVVINIIEKARENLKS